jgi:hypothetical protein
MDDDIGLTMDKLGGLLLDSDDDPGMAMSGIGHADAGRKIQVPATVSGVKVSSFPAIDKEFG